ncbi:MAG: ATP-grasp domain-containing protein [Thermoanaerobaculia bacterium]|nr:ATP-grasp domain-containing protein [Thermoanaerobaculia bacterium]
MLVPVGSEAIRCLVDQPELRRRIACPVPTAAAFRAAFDKQLFRNECRRLGIPAPRTYSESEARRILTGAGPRTLVVKPAHDVGEARGVRYVSSQAELDAAVSTCERRFGRSLIEEMIPGGQEEMRTVVLLFGRESKLLAAFTMQKLRTAPISGGVTASARSTADPDLVPLVLPFFRHWEWSGVAEVELKRDPRDGRLKVIEVNPRCPGYLRFPVYCGVDLPRMAMGVALGEEGPEIEGISRYRTGAGYLAPQRFLQSLAHRRGGRVGTPRRLGSAVRELFSAAPLLADQLDDPLCLLATVVAGRRRRRGRG